MEPESRQKKKKKKKKRGGGGGVRDIGKEKTLYFLNQEDVFCTGVDTIFPHQ